MIDEDTFNPAIEEPAQPKSLMEQLRAKRSEIVEKKETFMAVPGYGTELPLLVRYRHLDRQEVEAVGKKVRGENLRDQGERQMRILMDTMILATDGFYVQEPGNNDPTQITASDEDPTPIGSWTEFATWLGADADQARTARLAVMFVFGFNEFAIGQSGMNLARWMANTDVNVDQEFFEG